MLVFVLNKNASSLMPCSPRKARLLLKSGKAKVKSRKPFTIQLIYGSAGYKQLTYNIDKQTEFNRDNYFEINFRPKQTIRQYFDLAQKGKGRVKYQVNSELKGFRKGDIVLIKGFEKQINSIYSNGTLAFARIKGEPSACKPEKCKLLEKQKSYSNKT